MDWQLPLVLLCLALAALYVARRTWRTWSGKGAGCGGGCKCDGGKAAAPAAQAKPLIPVEDLTWRLRGRRP
jgi:hypothetical protein